MAGKVYDNLNSITIGQIGIFLRVVELESFTATAMDMHMTQSAVSKTIAKIERELDMELFTRHYRELRVTEEGRLLYSYWKPALEKMSDSYEELYQKRCGDEDALQIGVTNTTDLNTYFWEIIKGFQSRYETVRLEFISDSMDRLIRSLSEHQLDVVFVPDFMKYRLENTGLSWMWAARSNVQIVLPKEHPLAKKAGTLHFDDISEMTFVTLTDSDYPENSRYIMEMFEESGHIWSGKKISYKTPESIQDFYRSGEGYMLTDRYFKFENEGRYLIRKPLIGFYNGIICGWDPGKGMDKKKKFLTFLKENIME